MIELYLPIAAFIFGATIGSFLNVVIYRLPNGLSIVRPASRCPNCLTPIKPIHNIPIISYLALKGKCAACSIKISPRYPMVEGLTGLLWAGAMLKSGPTPQLAADLVLITGLIVVTFIDLDHKIIPDSLSLGGIPVGLGFALLTGLGWKASLIGIVLGGGSLLLVAEGYRMIAKREGMGGGDVKLLAAIGAFQGWEGVIFTVFVASVVGAVAGVAAMRITRGGRHMEIPFGPFLSLGSVLYLYAGPQIITWYLTLGAGG